MTTNCGTGSNPVSQEIVKSDFHVCEEKLMRQHAYSGLESHIKLPMEKTECYSCHASRVPQCYGGHVKVDYLRDKNGKQKSGIDWVVSGNAQKKLTFDIAHTPSHST